MGVEQTKKVIEVVGVSDESIAKAVANAITRASQTLRGLEWFEVSAIRGRITENKPEFQAEVKIGFQLENQDL
jgi:flavin-binding protein dodecin